MSRRPLPPRARDLAVYLRELGWGDLYLGPAEGGAAGASDGAEDGAGATECRVALEVLAKRAESCTACGLAEGRHSVVFGVGHPDAELMFVGEAPGAEEDRQGIPFVGRAGELLTRIIGAMGRTRDEVYVANIVKCRPPGNRDPEPEEVAACRGFLEGQIEAVRPRVIVALGRVAAQTLLATGRPLGRLRNEWHRVGEVPVRATYHPAALLRNAGFKRPLWEDMQEVMSFLDGSSTAGG